MRVSQVEKLHPPGKVVRMFVRPHVGVLHYLFSFAIIAQSSSGHAVQELVVTTHYDFKHRRFARQRLATTSSSVKGSCEMTPSAGSVA
jgi:hypothetical protein